MVISAMRMVGAVTGVAHIKSMLPHRHPMLLLDAVTELVPGERARAVKAISGAEPWYRYLPDGAPPEAYAYPAALLVESWCQCAALLAAGQRADVADGAAVALFGGLADAGFHADVYPGDVLEHRAEAVRRIGDTWILRGASSVRGELVLRIDEATVALRPAEVLTPAGGRARD